MENKKLSFENIIDAKAGSPASIEARVDVGFGDEEMSEALVVIGIHIGVVEGGPEFVALAL